MISSASAGIGTPPRELDIFAMPAMPTNAYIGPMGWTPPKTGPTIWPPTWKDEPGEEWSTPTGLEVDVLVRPPHRPVDLPDQLAVAVFPQQERAAVTVRAGVGQLGRRIVVAGHGRRITAAGVAVRLVRVVAGGSGAVVVGGRSGTLGGGLGRGGVIGVQLLVLLATLPLTTGRGARRAALRAIAIEDRVDRRPLAHGEQHLLDVRPGRVHLGLADAAIFDAEIG